MESNAIYTTSDAGLSRFFGKIYGDRKSVV